MVRILRPAFHTRIVAGAVDAHSDPHCRRLADHLFYGYQIVSVPALIFRAKWPVVMTSRPSEAWPRLEEM